MNVRFPHKRVRLIADAGLMLYAALCFAFWLWLIRPHPIPHGAWANEMAGIVIIGGVVFGLAGIFLNKKMLINRDLDLPLVLAIYGLAAFFVLLFQFYFRGFPESAGAWMLVAIMFLSFASALYYAIGILAARSLLLFP